MRGIDDHGQVCRPLQVRHCADVEHVARGRDEVRRVRARFMLADHPDVLARRRAAGHRGFRANHGGVQDHPPADPRGVDPGAHLENNDAYPFFEALGDLVVTGPTGTNVADLAIGWAWKS